jgi:class 3 adenylate cyclase
MPRIPWAAILTHGPAIVAAAKRLLATAGTDRSHERNQTIEARIGIAVGVVAVVVGIGDDRKH